MSNIAVIQGSITEQRVDVIVNTANHRMRGGGGVDGAIHRAGGPEILAECIDLFPDGLDTGDAGFTTGGNLPATWVVHTVGPNYGRGQQDPALLESCYRRAIEVAEELGARSIAFPLVSAGIYRWPLQEAVEIAVRTLASTESGISEIRIVALDEEICALVQQEVDSLVGALAG